MSTNGSINKYIRKIDYREPTADYKIANQIEDFSEVLEIGTSSGYMSEFLVNEKKCIVTGVEFDKELFEKAKIFFKEGFNENLNDIEKWQNKLKDNSFDYIICQDVLEHLLDPIKVLNVLKNKLKSKGKILISIPNVSHNAILMEILKDEFTYDKTGSLDSTHFKFFTAKSFKEGCNSIGLKCLHHDITYLVPEDSSLKRSYLDYSLKEREVLFDHYNGHVFQNIFAFGREEDYNSVEEAKLNLNKLPNYDEIIIESENKFKKFFYHDYELLEYVLEEDTTFIKIYPSIRLKEYKIECYINDEKVNLNTLTDGLSISPKDENKCISTGTEIIKLKRNFKLGDKISIKISHSKSIMDDILKGKEDAFNELTKLKAKIDDYKIISFAAIDTLLLNNVLERTHIFDILEDIVYRKYGIKNFAWLRKTSEANAYIEKGQVTLDNIYNEIGNKISSADIANDIKKEEVILISKFIMLNPFMEQILEYCNYKKKKILVVNNDVLSKRQLEKILENNKVYDVEIINYESLEEYKGKKILHIGNDVKNDLIYPKTLNIDVYNYIKVLDRVENRKNIKVKNYKESIIRAIQCNLIYNGLNHKYFEKFGALNIAPIYYTFTKWLFENTKDMDNLFFLARDGYMPHKVYELLKEKYNKNIQTKYLLASRKAYQIPGLLKVEEEKLIKTFTEFNLQLDEKITLEDAIVSAGLNINDVDRKIITNNGFSSTKEIINFSNLKRAQNVIKELCPKIKEKLNEKLNLADAYLRQEGVYNFDRVNVVDIGWRGSVQYYMSKITSKDIYGYYFGTLVTEYSEIKDKMKGCFCNKYLPVKRSEYILDNIMMFELIFSAPYPPLIGFKKHGSKITPEYSKVVSKSFIESVDVFQNSALRVIEEFIKYDEYLDNIDLDFAISSYKRFIDNKNYEDIIKFYELQTNIGYGEKQKKYVYEVTPDDIVINNKKVLEESNYSFWKGAIYINGIDNIKDYNDFVNETLIKTKLNKVKSSRYYRGLKVILKGKKRKK